MKCQSLFSGKNKKIIFNLSSAESVYRVVKVNNVLKFVCFVMQKKLWMRITTEFEISYVFLSDSQWWFTIQSILLHLYYIRPKPVDITNTLAKQSVVDCSFCFSSSLYPLIYQTCLEKRTWYLRTAKFQSNLNLQLDQGPLRRQFAGNVKIYFLGKIRKNILKCCLLKFLPSMLNISWSHMSPSK